MDIAICVNIVTEIQRLIKRELPLHSKNRNRSVEMLDERGKSMKNTNGKMYLCPIFTQRLSRGR